MAHQRPSASSTHQVGVAVLGSMPEAGVAGRAGRGGRHRE